MKKKGTKKGFTLIELSFAILFISTLLLTLTLIATEIISIYRKGYSIKTVNSVGRDLIDDFSKSFSSSVSAKLDGLCTSKYPDPSSDGYKNCLSNSGADYGLKFVFQQFEEPIEVNGKTSTNYPYGGIICTGQYSYIYQTGFLLNKDLYTPSGYEYLAFKYKDNTGEHTTTDFRLLKFSDVNRSLCAGNLEDNYTYKTESWRKNNPNDSHLITMSELLAEPPVELLADSDTKLALFNVNVPLPAQTSSTGKALYSASFILATIAGGVDIKTNGNYCTTPEYYSSDFSYCAINKFNFSIQANGGGKK